MTSHVVPAALDGPARPQPSGHAAADPPAVSRPAGPAGSRPPGRPAGSVVRLGADMVAEPLPTGAWLRPAGTSQAVDIYRGLLSRNLAGSLDLFRIVIGYPDAPAVPIHQILELCGLITAKPAGSTRFVRFGPVSGPAPAPTPASARASGPGPAAQSAAGPAASGDQPVPVRDLGQALADLLGRAVVLATGIRLLYPAAQGGVETRALLPEGAMTWLPYATDFGYQPRRSAPGATAAPAAPVALDAAAPIPGLAQIRPGSFALGGGKVLEVVQSGLWLRSDPEPANSATVRGLPPSPSQPNLIYETHASFASEHARRAARKVARRLDERFRTTVRILSADQLDRYLEDQAGRHGAVAGFNPSALLPGAAPQAAEALPGQRPPAAQGGPAERPDDSDQPFRLDPNSEQLPGRSHTVAAAPPEPAGSRTEAAAPPPGEVRREAPAPDSAVPVSGGWRRSGAATPAPDNAVPVHPAQADPRPDTGMPDAAAPADPRTGSAQPTNTPQPTSTPWFLRESAPPTPPAADPGQDSATGPTGPTGPTVPADRRTGAAAALSTTPSKDWNPR